MAKFIEADLGGFYETQLDRFSKDIQEKLVFAGVAAVAKVIYDEARLNAEKHKKTGLLQSAIYRAYSPENSGETVKTYRISWNKKAAPHGHLIEFGTSRAPAYPFLRPALSRIGDAFDAGKERMAQKLDEIKSEK